MPLPLSPSLEVNYHGLLGSEDHNRGLPSGFSFHPFHPPPSPHSGLVSTGQGRYRTGASFWLGSWFLLQVLPRSEKRRGSSPDYGTQRSQRSLKSQKVPYDDSTVCFSLHPGKGVDGYHRPSGCLLPCLDPPIFEEESTFHNRRCTFPVQGAAIQTLFLRESFHQMHGGDSSSSSTPRCTNFPVLGRLATSGQIQGLSTFLTSPLLSTY